MRHQEGDLKSVLLAVTITGEEGARWERVLGRAPTLPVRSDHPISVTTENAGRQPAYLVDLPSVDLRDLDSIIGHLAAKYRKPREDVAEYISDHGVPVLQLSCEENFNPRERIPGPIGVRYLFV